MAVSPIFRRFPAEIPLKFRRIKPAEKTGEHWMHTETPATPGKSGCLKDSRNANRATHQQHYCRHQCGIP